MISIFKNLISSHFTRMRVPETASIVSYGLLETPSSEFSHHTVRTCVFSDHGKTRIGAIISDLNDYKPLSVLAHIQGEDYYTIEDAMRLTRLVRRRFEKNIMKRICYEPFFEPTYFKLCVSFEYNVENKDTVFQSYLTALIKEYPILSGHDFIRVKRKSAKNIQYIICWPCIRRGKIIRFYNYGSFLRQLAGSENNNEEKLIH